MRVSLRLLVCGLLLLAGGCVKVKPSAYQLALQRYYRNLLGGATEQSLNQAIAGLSKDLEKQATDPNMLLLRTSARLELLRLGVENRQEFDTAGAKAFFDDLRLVQTLAEKPNRTVLWLNARVQTMFGDALLLKSQAKRDSEGGASEVREQIVRMQLFRLAADAYLRAAALASQSLTTAKASKDLEPNVGSLGQEIDNARDGYVNAMSGMAQSEFFLRLFDDARKHLLEANGIVTGGVFPPAGAAATSPSSLFSYSHDLVAKQASSLETLTPNDFPARLQFAQTALREEIAARLLSNPMQPISGSSLRISDRIALYLAGITVQAVELKLNAATDPEGVEFLLRPDPLYASARFRAEVPLLTLQSGTEKIPIRFVPTNAPTVQSFAIKPEGILISIQTKAGTNTVTSEANGIYFLGRANGFLTKDKPVTITGPANNVIAQMP